MRSVLDKALPPTFLCAGQRSNVTRQEGEPGDEANFRLLFTMRTAVKIEGHPCGVGM